MATFIKVDERWAAVAVLAAAIAAWAVLAPESFASAVASLEGAINGAIQGASG